MKLNRRRLSLLLAICMLMTRVPAMVFGLDESVSEAQHIEATENSDNSLAEEGIPESGEEAENPETGGESSTETEETETGGESGTETEETEAGGESGTETEGTEAGGESGTETEETETDEESGTETEETETGGESGTETEEIETGGETNTETEKTETGEEANTDGETGQLAEYENVISGIIWLDEDNDGIKGANEYGVSDYPVSLYVSDNREEALQTVLTDTDGLYWFENLDPQCVYVVGILTETVDETEYLMPVIGLSENNKFILNDEYTAVYSESLEFTEEITVFEHIDAGVRLVPQKMATGIINIDLGSASNNTGYSVSSDAITFNTEANNHEYVITGSGRRIVIQNNIVAKITFNDVTITASVNNEPAVELQGNAQLHLVLASGTANELANSLVSSNDHTNQGNNAGIYVPQGTKLTITGTGLLKASGGPSGAGIGGGGEVTISGGLIVAEGGFGAAGIGGNQWTNAGLVRINGSANIRATGGRMSAGIGGGAEGDGNGHVIIGDNAADTLKVVAIGGEGLGVGIGGGGNGVNLSGDIMSKGDDITINGGYVEAKSDAGGAGIGSRAGVKNINGVITINGGTVIASGSEDSAGIGSSGSSKAATGEIYINGGTVKATGGENAAGIGGGTGVGGGKIVITGGTIEAYGAKNGAGIGGGQDRAGGVIRISDNAYIKKAQGGSTGGAGIGSGRNGSNIANDIVISGGTIVAYGGSGGAGIGGGYYVKGGSITISGGNITAEGGASAAGIGTGSNPSSSSVNNIKITGGTVFAKGGNSGGAGIGAGQLTYAASSGSIEISGSADVTATVGSGSANNASAIGGSAASGAVSANLHISDTAIVRAVSTNKVAIDASGDNLGNGYYINGYFDNPIKNGNTNIASQFQIFESGGISSIDTIDFPAGAKYFAYANGKSSPVFGNIKAVTTQGLNLGTVVTAESNSKQIPYVNTKVATNVKIGAYLNTPSVTEITTNSAKFVSKGGDPYGGSLALGQFIYSPNKSVNAKGVLNSSEAVALTFPYILLDYAPMSTYNLVPNTQYYLQAYMKTSTNDELTSGLLPFSTKPEITSMTVSHTTDHDKVLVSAVLPTNSPNLVDITDVTIYWDTDSNIVTNPSLAGNSITLTSGQYSNSGFTDVLVTGLTGGQTYYVVVVITNSNGDTAQSDSSKSIGSTDIKVMVPTNILFAAFASDGGKVTSPTYGIGNNSFYPIRVKLSKFTLKGLDGLGSFTDTAAAMPDNSIRLRLAGTHTTPTFSWPQAAGTYLTEGIQSAADVMGIIPASAGLGVTAFSYFTVGGDYKGNFGTPKLPRFEAEFTFELITTP